MFDQTFVDTHAHTRRPWTVAVSLAAQTLLVGVVLIIPILHPELLHPKVDIPIFVHMQPMREKAHAEPAHSLAPAHSTALHVFTAPPRIPDGVKRVVDTDMTPGGESLAMVGPVSGTGEGNDIFSNLVGSIPETPPVRPKPPVQPQPAPSTGPIRVSEGVQAARLLYGPKPPYPPLARAARVEGRVRMQAIISPDGTIGSLQVTSGPPLLVLAAKDAVSRWRYQPTLLSGKAVEVLTEIDVIFTLSQ